MLVEEEDKGGGGDGADALGAEADPAQRLDGGLEQRVAAFGRARVTACSKFTVR